MLNRFHRSLTLLLCLALLGAPLLAQAPKPAAEEVCVLKTSMGTMAFRFFDKDAPRTVEHFKTLVRDGFYNGREFYRVVKGHVIQTGDGGENDRPKVKAEFNANPHVTGAVGLARDTDPDSGSTEIYLCHAPRPHLDGKYTVFGQLVEGMDVLEKIGNVEVDEKFLEGGVAFHKPKKPVIIEKAWIETRKIP